MIKKIKLFSQGFKNASKCLFTKQNGVNALARDALKRSEGEHELPGCSDHPAIETRIAKNKGRAPLRSYPES